MGLVYGNFIVFEGIDGSGKSSVIKHIVENYSGKDPLNRNIHALKEPSDGAIGRFITRCLKTDLLDEYNSTEKGSILLPLFEEDREHTITKIESLLKEDPRALMMCDRYVFSTNAYQHDYLSSISEYGLPVQHYCRHDGRLDKDKRFDWFPIPKFLFFLDIEPKEALERIKSKRGGEFDAYEKLEILEKVAKRYKERVFPFYEGVYCNRNPRLWDPMIFKSIDATYSVETIAKKVIDTIKDYYYNQK